MILSTVTVRRTSDPSRWVRVTLSLRPQAAGAAFVEYAPEFLSRITPADQEAGAYQDANWLSGVVSGLGYAWRRWLRPDRGVRVSELRGHLGHGDVGGIAAAVSIAVCELLGEPPGPGEGEWAVDETFPVVPGAELAVSAP